MHDGVRSFGSLHRYLTDRTRSRWLWANGWFHDRQKLEILPTSINSDVYLEMMRKKFTDNLFTGARLGIEFIRKPARGSSPIKMGRCD